MSRYMGKVTCIHGTQILVIGRTKIEVLYLIKKEIERYLPHIMLNRGYYNLHIEDMHDLIGETVVEI